MNMKTEIIFAVIVSVLAGVMAYLFAPFDGVSEILTLRALYIATLLGGAFATLTVLRGTHYDVLEEIFDENNTAAAIVVAAIFVSIALVIKG